MGEFNLLSAQRRIFRSTLRPLERLVALALLDHWSKESPRPWPSLRALSDHTGLSRRAVWGALQGLAASGAIRIHLQRPTRDGAPIPNVKPTNHYDLKGLLSLPVHEVHQCTSDTSAGDAPVHERTPTGARGARIPVHELHPKEPKEGTQEGTHTDFALEPPSSMPDDPVGQVLKHWTEQLWSKHHDRAPKFNKKRRAPVSARLRDGYSVADLQRAIDAVARSGFHNGENDKGKVYIEPETIFRDAGRVDSWLATKEPVFSSNRLPPPQMGMSERYEAGGLE